MVLPVGNNIASQTIELPKREADDVASQSLLSEETTPLPSPQKEPSPQESFDGVKRLYFRAVEIMFNSGGAQGDERVDSLYKLLEILAKHYPELKKQMPVYYSQLEAQLYQIMRHSKILPST
jgi:hypothetical protein